MEACALNSFKALPIQTLAGFPTVRLDELRLSDLGPHIRTAYSASLLPLIVKAIDSLGINVPRTLEMPKRWLATDPKPRHFDRIVKKLPTTFDRSIQSSVVGRIVVEIGGARVRMASFSERTTA